MANATGITVDGRLYHVFVQYPDRTRDFSIVEGNNNGTAITGRTIRDIIGTAYSYTMTILADPNHPIDYDDLYYVLSAPVDYHRVSLPFGQTTLNFDAQIISGSDKDLGMDRGYHRWDDLNITFTPMEPQRK